jgi:hypothetical protein
MQSDGSADAANSKRTNQEKFASWFVPAYLLEPKSMPDHLTAPVRSHGFNLNSMHIYAPGKVLESPYISINTYERIPCLSGDDRTILSLSCAVLK